MNERWERHQRSEEWYVLQGLEEGEAASVHWTGDDYRFFVHEAAEPRFQMNGHGYPDVESASAAAETALEHLRALVRLARYQKPEVEP